MSARSEETYEEAVWRLALRARDEGVKLYHDSRDGRYYASSVSTPGQLHYLTGVSCDCLGFTSHQRCKHHAALLVALGWTGSDPEPAPEPITGCIGRCEECGGLGEIQYTCGTGPHRFVYDWTTCPHCRGCGVEKQAA